MAQDVTDIHKINTSLQKMHCSRVSEDMWANLIQAQLTIYDLCLLVVFLYDIGYSGGGKFLSPHIMEEWLRFLTGKIHVLFFYISFQQTYNTIIQRDDSSFISFPMYHDDTWFRKPKRRRCQVYKLLDSRPSIIE